ncbi:MAG TPA: MerR family transcriptional regulator [Bacteroidales bacterium]|nr:MerR family transcriptional regulator [Bacteroidales bacterium]
MPMGEYTIKDLERLSGIKAHTIRIWEKRYDIVDPGRTDTNRRRYSDEDLKKLINISILNRNGFKISKIASLSVSEIQEKVAYMSQDPSQTDTQIESLVVAMINLDELSFNELVTRSILSRGFVDTFTSIIFPFLHRVGMLWVTGSISPGQEHFVTNLIRQKLISNIDAQVIKRNDASKILLFLPENEMHELGLLFLTYLAKKYGHEVLYLGPVTPLDSVRRSVDIWPADFIVTATYTEIAAKDRDKYLDELSDSFKDRKIIVSGNLAKDAGSDLPSNIICASTPEEFIGIIDS